jgi:hypothetical protein
VEGKSKAPEGKGVDQGLGFCACLPRFYDFENSQTQTADQIPIYQKFILSKYSLSIQKPNKKRLLKCST